MPVRGLQLDECFQDAVEKPGRCAPVIRSHYRLMITRWTTRPTFALYRQTTLVERASDFVRKVLSAQISLNFPVIEIGVAK